MNEQDFNRLIEEIGPERLLMLIQMLDQLSQQDKQALVQALQQMIQGQTQGAPAQPPPANQGQQNLYG